jgi:hypothetical protein
VYRPEVRRRVGDAPTRPIDSAAERRRQNYALTLYETNVSGARALLRFLRSELDALALAKQLKDGAADRAAMKEVFDPAFIADKPEALVNEKPCDRAGRHTRVLRMSPAVC